MALMQFTGSVADFTNYPVQRNQGITIPAHYTLVLLGPNGDSNGALENLEGECPFAVDEAVTVTVETLAE